MSGTDFHQIPIPTGEMVAIPPVTPGREVEKEGRCRKKLHQIATVRRNQNISIATCARKLGITVQEARCQEQPTSDLSLSQLMAWKEILDVPFSELVGQEAEILENPIRNRALMIKVMKTAKQILLFSREQRVHNMAQTLVDQLVELMPELMNVSVWPDVGQSHENRDPGIAVFRRFDPEVARRLES